MSIDTTEHELACIQSPSPSCKRNEVSFPKDISPFWRNHLHIYTAAAFQTNTWLPGYSQPQNVHATSFFIPKFFVFTVKSDCSKFVNDEDTSHFAAIKAALEWLRTHPEREIVPNVVIFTQSERSLERIRCLLDKNEIHKDEQMLLDDILHLRRLGTNMAFAWIPPKSKVSPHMFVKEYSEDWFRCSGHLNFRFDQERAESCRINNELKRKSHYIVAVTFERLKCFASANRISEISLSNYSLPFIYIWSDRLFVYTDVTEVYDGLDRNKKYITSVYIPELGKCFKKENWLTVRNMQRASFAALHFAMYVVSELDIQSEVVFFTEHREVVQGLYKCALRNPKTYSHISMDGIQRLRDNDITFSVALCPPKSKCSLFRTVTEIYDEPMPDPINMTDVQFDTGSMTLFKSDIACVQLPSNKVQDITEDLFRNIPSLWRNYLHVYTADFSDDDYVITSLYIPQMNIFERRLRRSVNDIKLSCLQFAIERIKVFDIQEKNVVIFSDCVGTLKRLITELQVYEGSKCEGIIYDTCIVRRMGKDVAFAWIPPDETIPEYALVLEFAKAWKYDDYDNKPELHSGNKVHFKENIVFSNYHNNDLENVTINHELARIQQPPKAAVLDRTDYFIGKVVPFWQSSLQVYTVAVLVNESTGHFMVSYYIPELNILEKKSKYMTNYDDMSAQLTALDAALEKLRNCNQKDLVLYTSSKTALTAILHALDHTNTSILTKSLVNSIIYFNKRNKCLGFAWMPPELQISSYKIVVEYAAAAYEANNSCETLQNSVHEDSVYMEPVVVGEDDEWVLVDTRCESGEVENLSEIDIESDENLEDCDYDCDMNYFKGKVRLKSLKERKLI